MIVFRSSFLRTFICLLSGLIFLQLAKAQNPDEQAIEDRLHSIYKRFNESPTSPQMWDEALGRAKERTYTIQKKDTLWDISETFFGDPFFWPKIWSVNPNIYNPHEIVPDVSLKFVPGTSDEPPQLTIAKPSEVEEEEAPPPSPQPTESADAKVANESEAINLGPQKQKAGTVVELDMEEVVIPLSKAKKGVNSLPKSLPPYRYFREAVEPEIEVRQIRMENFTSPMAITSFASDSTLPSVGEVVENESGSPAATERDSLIVKGQDLQAGQRYLVVRQLGTIKGDSDFGRVNQIEGQIEITEVVDSSSGFFRAKVVKAFSAVRPGSELIQENLTTYSPGMSGQTRLVDARLTGGQHSVLRNLFDPYAIVFLNAGSLKGVAVGDRIAVYRNPQNQRTTRVRENAVSVGEIQVVRVEQNVATAVVLNVTEEMMVGDLTSPLGSSSSEIQ